jgi:magnesium-protoporphyrin O-methyltransferase
MPCSCCAGESLDIFGEKSARRELRRYLSKGLGGGDARLIVSWAEDSGLEGSTVAEVGGGIGQLQAELLRRGASRGTVIEVVAGYRPVAGELARAVHVDDRSAFVLADLLENPNAFEQTDVVVLRRVVCCSPEGPDLMGRAAARTRRTLLASYPRDRFLVRAVVRLQNLGFRLTRKRKPVFVHAPGRLERAAATNGLRRTRVARGPVWETAQFEPVREALGPALVSRIPRAETEEGRG